MRTLPQSEERFRSTFEGAPPVGVVNVSPNGYFSAVNQGFCDLVGYSCNELLTMTVRQLPHPDYHQADADRIRQNLAGEVSHIRGTDVRTGDCYCREQVPH